MFIFQLMGGLGNQLFQYAAARSLSLERNIPVKFHFDDPYQFVQRRYDLGAFNVEVEMATKAELKPTKPKRRWEKKWWQLQGKDPNAALVTERKAYHFDEAFFNVADRAYLYGFWQSEQYFKRHEGTIRQELRFRNPPNEANTSWLNSIKGCNAVSVHVRRGDYVSVAVANDVHGTCSLAYYEQAIAYVRERVETPVLFFFSDDIAWAREHIKTGVQAFYVDVNDDRTNYEDLRLMSACKHHIIANSSFSWWGAWLNPSPSKLVIAPKKWLNAPVETPDLLPAGWMCL